MPVNPTEVRKRWENIRNLPECDLSLTPQAVREYLKEPESTIVHQRIFETLSQLADYRIEKASFQSDGESAGDLATCEGLETFLVPAVERAHRFSDFLQNYPAKDRFAQKFRDDVNNLLEKWNKEIPVFSGDPYTDLNRVRAAVKQSLLKKLEPFNITETAAMACRIVIHIITLKQRAQDGEKEFAETIGKDLDDAQMLGALSNAISFLVTTFQKSNVGATDEEKIANATWGNSEGSGWSWTAGPVGVATGLAPLLFFTAAVVDAFAELDLYLIRPGRDNAFADSAPALQEFYQDKQKQLFQLQLCVDMARRWVHSEVLPSLTVKMGQYEEEYPDGSQTKIVYTTKEEQEIEAGKEPEKRLETYRPDWERASLKKPPLLYYNTIYALQILLWSFGDRSEDGSRLDDAAKSSINRALTILAFNYDNIPAVKQVLSRFPHVFLLPGQGIFNANDKDSKCEYMDAGFLPLLTRLLVLFVVYGVGDRNLFEPILRNLYVELLQRRHRTQPKYGALWSIDKIEVYSTQRSVQALTFYHAYAEGKELAENRPEQTGSEIVSFHNKTGMRLHLELVSEAKAPVSSEKSAPERSSHLSGVEDLPGLFKAKFAEDSGSYLNKINWPTIPKVEWEPGKKVQEKVDVLLDKIFEAGCAGRFRDLGVAAVLIDNLLDLWKEPGDGQRAKEAEFQLLESLYMGVTG